MSEIFFPCVSEHIRICCVARDARLIDGTPMVRLCSSSLLPVDYQPVYCTQSEDTKTRRGAQRSMQMHETPLRIQHRLNPTAKVDLEHCLRRPVQPVQNSDCSKTQTIELVERTDSRTMRSIVVPIRCCKPQLAHQNLSVPSKKTHTSSTQLVLRPQVK